MKVKQDSLRHIKSLIERYINEDSDLTPLEEALVALDEAISREE